MSPCDSRLRARGALVWRRLWKHLAGEQGVAYVQTILCNSLGADVGPKLFRIDAMTDDDWPDVLRIYKEGLLTGIASFEVDAPSWSNATMLVCLTRGSSLATKA
jgi:hypothetical protein